MYFIIFFSKFNDQIINIVQILLKFEIFFVIFVYFHPFNADVKCSSFFCAFFTSKPCVKRDNLVAKTERNSVKTLDNIITICYNNYVWNFGLFVEKHFVTED